MEYKKSYFNSVSEIKYRLEDFLYELPEQLIAQYPLKERDSCRLMIIERDTGEIRHDKFKKITDLIKPKDCIVLNDTKVFPARLFGNKDRTGAQVEIFLLRNLEGNLWEVLVKPARKVRIGNKIIFGEDLWCDIVDNTLSGGRIVEFNCNDNFFDLLEKYGHVPLPPYIKRQSEKIDKEYYQTVYAEKPGAVAAPTAGLHFTKEIINRLRLKGVNFAKLTLHVGLGTFRPVKVDDISRHKMDSEYYNLDATAAQIINTTRESGGSIIAIGTTSVRVLETLADSRNFIRPGRGWTDKFIFPPYEFRMVDKLLTNFHLPGSTLLMLVSAFCGLDLIKTAYRDAIKKKYRFFSYGDPMFVF